MPPMSSLTIPSTDKMWQIIHSEIRLVKFTHNTKQANMQGGFTIFTMESVH